LRRARSERGGTITFFLAFGAKPITPKSKPAATNVVDRMEALGRSGGKKAAPAKAANPAKKPRKAAAGQKEMLMSIEGKEPAKEAAAKKTSQGAAEVGVIFETPGDWNEWGREESNPCPRPPKAPPGENLPPRLAVRMRNIAQGPFAPEGGSNEQSHIRPEDADRGRAGSPNGVSRHEREGAGLRA